MDDIEKIIYGNYEENEQKFLVQKGIVYAEAPSIFNIFRKKGAVRIVFREDKETEKKRGGKGNE